MREAPKPPITNRGVERTKEERERLTVCIDWCQITVWGVTPQEIAEDILRIPYFLMRTDLRSGIQGYRPLMCFDDIRVFEPSGGNKDNGYQILMAGQGCRNFEIFLEANEETWYDFFERLLNYKINVPRIDLAIDDHKTYFKISRLVRMAKKDGLVVSRMKAASEIGAFSLNSNEHRGDTLNFGSKTSELFLTFYEKGYEQASKLGLKREEIDTKWNRYELKFRQKKAQKIMLELIKRREIYTIAMEALNSALRFIQKPEDSEDQNKRRWPTWGPWEWFMRDVGKIKLTMEPKMKDYYARLNWLQTAVAPTLWVYMEIDRILGRNEVQKMLRNAKIEKKHRQMVEDYIHQLKVASYIDMEEKEELEHVVKMQKEGYLFGVASAF